MSEGYTPLPDIGMSDPGHTGAPDLAGGTAKKKTDLSGESGQPMHTSNDASMQIQGMAPDGNSSGIPAASPITPLLSGDPNNTAVDADDGAMGQEA